MFEKVVGGDFMYYTILAYHGVKGQRWGIRRYQRLDGSLTPEGRAKYAKILNKMSKKRNRSYGSNYGKNNSKRYQNVSNFNKS